MNSELIWVLSMLVGAILLFITNKVRMDVVALLIIILFVLSGTLTLPQALAIVNPNRQDESGDLAHLFERSGLTVAGIKAAARRAVARPMPEVAPVITMDCWLSGFRVGFMDISLAFSEVRTVGPPVSPTSAPYHMTLRRLSCPASPTCKARTARDPVFNRPHPADDAASR